MKLLNDDLPIYLQLRKHIEERILNRHIQEEEAVHSIRNLAREYQINPVTVGNALSALMEEGILFKKRGVGIFVSPQARSLIISLRSKSFISEKLEPILRSAKQLELSKDSIINLLNTIYGEEHE